MDHPLSVLVVEDDPVDFKLLQRTLRHKPALTLVCEHTVADGVTRLTKEHFDVILLDLSLPDSNGLVTIDAITQTVSTPVVVLSNLHDESTAFQSIQHGAQDYLFKDQMDAQLISRTLRYAIERYTLLEELHDIRQIARRESELRRLQSSTDFQSQPPTHSPTTQGALKSEHPAVFKQALDNYGDMISHSLERREYQVRSMNLSKLLKDLAQTLGFHGATPRDVMQLHTACVAMKLQELPPQKNALCHEEARYLLSGLLGHLCYYYMEHTVVPHSPPTLQGQV